MVNGLDGSLAAAEGGAVSEKPRYAYLNGDFLEASAARVSIFDRGFLYGDTVYETLRTHLGAVVFWGDHYRRLRRSCQLVHFEIDWDAIDLRAVLDELVRRNDLRQARIRITLSRGVGGPDQVAGFEPTWVVTAEPLPVVAEETYRQGVKAIRVNVNRNSASSLNPEAKSGNYLNNLLARREARLAGADEGIMLNPDGYVAEGASTNVFWVCGGDLFTPGLEVGILHGVTRAKILELARRDPEIRGVGEVAAPARVLSEADEIFVTSTTWEALAVSTWEGRPVGTGQAGPVALRLRHRLRALYPDSPVGS